MLRTVLTWRWVGLTVLLVAGCVVMVWLGTWQWQRSTPETDRADAAPADVTVAALTPVEEVVGVGAFVPVAEVGRLVRVSGTWVPARTLLVADRDRDGVPGRWVVTAVRLDDGPAAGALVPVVRGWLPADPGAPASLPPAPDGVVDLGGWLQAAEPLDLPADVAQPDGVVPLLSTPDLVNRWPEELLGGFVVQADVPGATSSAAPTTGVAVLEAAPETASGSRDWRNLAYAAQWFVFAAFAVLLWWRMLRDDLARQEAAAEAAAAARTAPPPVPERSSS